MSLADELKPLAGRCALAMFYAPGINGPGRERRAAVWRDMRDAALEARALAMAAPPAERADVRALAPDAFKALTRKRCADKTAVAACCLLARAFNPEPTFTASPVQNSGV